MALGQCSQHPPTTWPPTVDIVTTRRPWPKGRPRRGPSHPNTKQNRLNEQPVGHLTDLGNAIDVPDHVAPDGGSRAIPSTVDQGTPEVSPITSGKHSKSVYTSNLRFRPCLLFMPVKIPRPRGPRRWLACQPADRGPRDAQGEPNTPGKHGEDTPRVPGGRGMRCPAMLRTPTPLYMHFEPFSG